MLLFNFSGISFFKFSVVFKLVVTFFFLFSRIVYTLCALEMMIDTKSPPKKNFLIKRYDKKYIKILF